MIAEQKHWGIPPAAQTGCVADRRAKEAIDAGLGFLDTLPQLPEGYNNPVETVDDPFDLKNLRFTEETKTKERMLTAQAVMTLVERINQLPDDSDKQFVIGIGTGGTISMSPTGEGGKLEPETDLNVILDKADPRLREEFEIDGLDAYAVDSSKLTIGDAGDLAIAMSYIWRNMKSSLKKRFAGFLVIHGTDTMPRDAGHLEMMLGKNMPFNIVHTGAQKTINQKVNDARENVGHSMRMLQMLRNNHCSEAVTVMGGRAVLSIGMTKVSDTHAKAMATHMHRDVVDFGALPDPDKHVLPVWLRENNASESRPFDPLVYRGPNRIGEARAEMEEDPRAVVAAMRLAARKAMLLVTYGASTYDPDIATLIGQEARRQNLPAFAVSPVNADPKLDTYGASQALIDAGVLPLYMTIEAARAKLMRAFATFGDNIARVREFMTDDFIGEIPTRTNKRELLE